MKNFMEEINNMTNNNQMLPWHKVETAILQEKKWLLDVFDFSEYNRESSQNRLPISLDQMLRQISISLVRGDMHAQESHHNYHPLKE